MLAHRLYPVNHVTILQAMSRVIRFLPPLFRLLLITAFAGFAVLAMLRGVFWFVFRSVSAEAPAVEILQALYLGLKFDLRLALWLCLPLLALGWIPWLSPVRHRHVRLAWLGYFVLAQAAVLFLYFVDFGHYAYLHQRLNVTLLDHLSPLSVAAQMAWETYPVLWGLVGLILCSAAYAWVLRRLAWNRVDAAASPISSRVRRAMLASGFVALFALGLYGKWSWYPLRWSDAYFTNHEAVAALALNPVLFLWDTLDGKGERYDEKIVREHYPEVASLLGVTQPDARTLNFGRHVPARAGAPRRPMNLVVIHLESFAAYRTGVFGNRLNPTPNFDALTREGTLFTNFFVPAVPTARSVFTMLTGIPDYNGVRTASRNPMIVNQHTLINALPGHDRYYFLGGSATWGNVRGILSHNIHRLRVFEEGHYAAERADAWGVTDLDLFEAAHRQLADSKKPFFAFIQTSGNHRPYTIPENNRRGFEWAAVDDRSLRDNSFESLAAYNGIRYFDHALGHFFSLARRSPYFENTVFVLYGDHGNPSVKDIPYERIGLTGVHVPFLVYAPGLNRQGRRIETVASLVDLLPTSLSLMSVPYRNQTMGRDLFAARPAREQFALIPDGLLDNEFLYRDGPGGKPRLYRYRSSDPAQDVHERYPDMVRELKRRRAALYETARYLLYHNPPSPVDGVSPVTDRPTVAGR